MKRYLVLYACAGLVITCEPAWAYELSYKNMFVAMMKLTPNFDYDNMVDGYMQVFRPAVWQRYQNDEFERHGKEEETLQMMKAVVANYNLNDPVSFHTSVQFGEYDVKQHQFALSPFSESSYFPVSYCCATGMPNQIQLFLSNPDIVNGLSMDMTAVKNFLDRHKQYGTVNRQLTADVSVKLTSLKGESQLVGEIVKVVLHDPMNGNATIETILPKSSS